jgi:hypothetical protein
MCPYCSHPRLVYEGVPGVRVFEKEERLICSYLKLGMFHTYPREVTTSVVVCDLTKEVLEAFNTFKRIEVMHLKSSQTLRSKDNGACNVSVDTHVVQSCT